mgnify:CR=1 FL=1
MLRRIVGKSLGSVVVAGALSLCAVSAQAQTNFDKDVGTAIDRGIEWLANNGAFNNPSSAGDASGLAMLALLEKRASGDPTDPPQGYDGASATDQARLRSAAVASSSARRVTSGLMSLHESMNRPSTPQTLLARLSIPSPARRA